MEAVKRPQSPLAIQPEKPPSTEQQVIVNQLSRLLIHVHYGMTFREDQKATVVAASKIFHSQGGTGHEAEVIRAQLKTKGWQHFLFLKGHPDTQLVLKNKEEKSRDINELLFSLISDLFHNLIHIKGFNSKRESINTTDQIDTRITVTVSHNSIDEYFYVTDYLQGDFTPHTIKQYREIVTFAESLLLGENVTSMGWQENELLEMLKKKPSVTKIFEVLIWALQFNMPSVRTTCRSMLTHYCTDNIADLEEIISSFNMLIATLDGNEHSSLSFSSLKPVISAELYQAVSSATTSSLQHFLESSKKNSKFKSLTNNLCEIIKKNPEVFQCVTVDCEYPLNTKDPKCYAMHLLKTTTSLRFINVGNTEIGNLNKVAQRLPNLKNLTIENAKWKSFSFSGELSIHTLAIRNCPDLEDISCLVYAPKLSTIELENMPKFNASLLPNTIKIQVHKSFD